MYTYMCVYTYRYVCIQGVQSRILMPPPPRKLDVPIYYYRNVPFYSDRIYYNISEIIKKKYIIR